MLFGLAVVAMLTSPALAVDLVVFQTFDVSPNAGGAISDSPQPTDPSVTSTDLTLNFPSVQPLGSAWGFALSAGNMNKGGIVPPDNVTLESAINGEGILDAGGNDGGDYITVTVTPNQTINFTDFSINIGHNNIDGANWTSPNIDLLTSLTGFASAANQIVPTFNPVDPGGFANANHTFDLSGVAALQGVNVPVEFRVYFSNVSNRMSIGVPFFNGPSNDVVISGTVVPEPGTLVLLGMGAIACLATRRNRM